MTSLKYMAMIWLRLALGATLIAIVAGLIKFVMEDPIEGALLIVGILTFASLRIITLDR